MTEAEKRKAAHDFAEYWKNNKREEGKTQPFWISFLHDVLGVEHPEKFIQFEEHPDEGKKDKRMDGYIKSTHVLIEQKSGLKDLGKPIRQSGGEMLTAFQQAQDYIKDMPRDEHPLFVITCNFSEFWIYDMNHPHELPEKIKLSELEEEYHRLEQVLLNGILPPVEKDLSVEAGKIVGKIYDALISQYENPKSKETLKSLNILCVRLVFCFYADKAGVLSKSGLGAFSQFLIKTNERQMRIALKELFKILDTPKEERDKYLEKDNPLFASFNYVNGGLFRDEDIEIPPFTEEIMKLLRESAEFKWNKISPTIFGAVFESTLDSKQRRSGGMHYTAIENIRKVIDPLFMDDLHQKFNKICAGRDDLKREKELEAFQKEIAELTFLDPACGSGNFLTQTFIDLRRLENDILKVLDTYTKKGQAYFDGMRNPTKVSIKQFYGIEISDFAVSVAKAALWIAEIQMIQETEDTLPLSDINIFPLKDYANIVQGNALKMNWSRLKEIVEPTLFHDEHKPKKKEEKEREPVQYDYIMGNPPFVGYHLQSKEQKEDILSLYVDKKSKTYNMAGKIDYVSGWYFKAAEFMQKTNIRAALVSTNSVTQGEQVAGIWKPLYDRFGIHIDFAHKTFKWDSDSQGKANVHCVIVGFSVAENSNKKIIFDGEERIEAKNINPYLIDADNIFIESRKEPICNVTKMVYGNKPADGGFLFLTPEEYEKVIAKEPNIKKYIRQICGSEEFINNKKRYCFWLVNASPKEIKESKVISSRVESVRKFRLNSPKEATKKSGDFPTLFQEIRQPDTDYIIVPRVSSEQRKYVPIGFLPSNVIASDATQLIPDATLYHFGVLTSDVHMAWMRAVCGRLKSDYRYSKDIVYNNFPWPEPNKEMKTVIEKTAQAILDARAAYSNSSFADLYDNTVMPKELLKAHKANDAAVRKAYGFKSNASESEIVAKLFKLYQEKIAT